FQFSNLFLHISELCIPTQHNAPPDAPSVEMLSSLGKTWQRRIGCHTRVLLPKKSLGSASALYMRMQPWGGLKIRSAPLIASDVGTNHRGLIWDQESLFPILKPAP